MNIFNVPLGLNLTDNDLVNQSPFNMNGQYGLGVLPPPGSYFMITEDGDFMITEVSTDFMITE